MSKLDPKARTYTTQSGRVFKLRKVSAMAMAPLTSDFDRKPVAPIIEVMIAGKFPRESVNYGDPHYQAELQYWQQEIQTRAMVNLINEGIDEEVAEEELARIRQHAPMANDADVKYLWAMQFVDANEMDKLAEAIMGQSLPTEAGMQQAAAEFPGTG